MPSGYLLNALIHILLVLASLALLSCAGEVPLVESAIPDSRFGNNQEPPPQDNFSLGIPERDIPKARFGDPKRDPAAIAEARNEERNGQGQIGGEVPCEVGGYEACTCVSGLQGLRPCQDTSVPCSCDTCPQSAPPTVTGMLYSSLGQYLFETTSFNLEHRYSDSPEGAGCVLSATLSMSAGSGFTEGCRLHIEAQGELIEGKLPLDTITFNADGACLGLGQADQGLYSATSFNESELTLSPMTLDQASSVSCWSGEASFVIEAILERDDGKMITFSSSTFEVAGSTLSFGRDLPCPATKNEVDINDCAKVVPEGSACNPYCQLGCELGEHCAVASNEIACVATGLGQLGDPCTGPYTCSYGLSCITLGNNGSARCELPCVNDESCPDSGLCSTILSLGTSLSLSFCAQAQTECSLFASASCGPGESCYLNGGSAVCLPEGNLSSGEVCDGQAANACAPGLQCLVTCRGLCATDAQSPNCLNCPGGFHEFSPGLSLGFCLSGGPSTLCDLYNQSGCDLGKSCYPVVGGVACRNTGTKAPGVACQSGNSCVPGYACVNGSCLKLCDLNAPSSLGTSCEALCPDSMGAILPASWEIGVCLDL